MLKSNVNMPLLVFLLIWFWASLAQANPEIDSLKKILPQLQDTMRVKVLNKICWKLRYTDFQEALKYGYQAITEAQKIKYNKGLIDAYSFTGVIYRNQGDYMKAGENFYKALRIAEESNSKVDIAYAHNNIGDILKSQGQNERALEFTQKAAQIFGQIGDRKGLAYAYIRTGEVYQSLQKHQDALEIFFKCLKIREEDHDLDGIESVSNRIGKSYEKLQDYEKALLYFNKSLSMSRQSDDLRSEYEALEDISRVYMATNRQLDALTYTLRSLEIAEQMGAKDGIKRCSESLIKIYAQKQDYQKAFFYQQKFIQIQQQLVNEENGKYLATMHNNYELQKKQDEIRLLNKDRQIQQLVVNAMLALVFFLGAVIFAVIKVSRQRKRMNESLAEKNHEIEQQSENLQIAHQQLSQKNHELEKTLVQVKTMQSQLVQSEKMASLGQLVAGIAHEINNPINFVSAGAETLQSIFQDLWDILQKYEKYDTLSPQDLQVYQEKMIKFRKKNNLEELQDDIQALIGDIKNGAVRTAEIVKGLRTFSRLDEHDLKTANLAENIESTLVILKNQIKDRIEIIRDYDQSMPDIDCFPGQLNQVFMNILANAIQAIEGKGTIRIGIRKDEKNAYVSISDTGKGMDEATQAKVFEPFFTTKDVGEGTGLGLSISHSIIEKHQGKILLDSQIGKGTTFTIVLPLTR